MTEITLFLISPYLFLFFGVCFSLWGKKDVAVGLMVVLALGAAFLNEIVGWQGLLIMVLTPISFFIWINHFFADILRKLGFVSFLVCAFLLLSHSIPGINNLLLFDQLVFSEGSAAFNMYLNFDKIFLGIVMFAFLPPMEKRMSLKPSLPMVFKYFFMAALVLLPIAIFSGYITQQFNGNPYVLLWALNNLFFVCFAEEVIFRRFIQSQLVQHFRNTQYGDLIAIFLGAVIFGLAHYSGGMLYIGLATIAGFFYGLCFYHSCNVRSSMMIHFMVNLTHALFFTYPFAAL